MATLFQKFELILKYLEVILKFRKTIMGLFGISLIANVVGGNTLLTKDQQLNDSTYALKVQSELIYDTYGGDKEKPLPKSTVDKMPLTDVLRRLEWLERQH